MHGTILAAWKKWALACLKMLNYKICAYNSYTYTQDFVWNNP